MKESNESNEKSNENCNNVVFLFLSIKLLKSKYYKTIMLILSLDPATKNMGCSILYIDNDKFKEFKESFKSSKSTIILDNNLKIKELDKKKLSDTDEITIEDLAITLSNVLKDIDNKYKIEFVIVENQMNINDKTKAIMTMIIYHYISKSIPVEKISPAVKGQVSYKTKNGIVVNIQNSESLKSTSYQANKHFATEFLKAWTLDNDIETYDKIIKEKKIDDMGDVLLQSYAFLIGKENLKYLHTGINKKINKRNIISKCCNIDDL